jgi:hypothetical protein
MRLKAPEAGLKADYGYFGLLGRWERPDRRAGSLH